MGEVYRAHDATLKGDVAIKVLPETVARDPERLARFQREAQSLAALNHPNIAHIHGLEITGATPAIVMDLVEGPTLQEVIARGRPVSEEVSVSSRAARGCTEMVSAGAPSSSWTSTRTRATA